MKLIKKLIFIISILMVVALNLFGVEESITFEYYYYTNKLYNIIFKTEIIPSDYVFISAFPNSYIYNLKTKEKKDGYRWEDMYKIIITTNRFGETFSSYSKFGDRSSTITIGISITKTDGYIQKAYKYSLTQPEIINKKDRGIYLFSHYDDKILETTKGISFLCFQNEYYNTDRLYEEEDLLNYNSNGRVPVYKYSPYMYFSYLSPRYIDGKKHGKRIQSGLMDQQILFIFN